MNNGLQYKLIQPDKSIADFVENFWFLHNTSNSNKEVIVVPNGRIDLSLFKAGAEPFRLFLMGLETQADQAIITPQTRVFVVSFKLLATEYIFHETVSDVVDRGKILPDGFWNLNVDDLNDFDAFVKKVTQKIQSLLPKEVDERKRKLFELIYESNGTVPVKELSEKVFWSARQINRYFNQQFGVSLKTFCRILRFRASFQHIKEGKLFPQQNFSDQSHFIKEIKKLSGVSPKELYKNTNDRFIQFSVLDKQ